MGLWPIGEQVVELYAMVASDNAELRLHDWYQLRQKAGVHLVATWRVPDEVSADVKDRACSEAHEVAIEIGAMC